MSGHKKQSTETRTFQVSPNGINGEADNKAEEEAEYAQAVNRYLQRTRDFAALRNQPSANNAPQQGADNAPRFVKRHVGFSA